MIWSKDLEDLIDDVLHERISAHEVARSVVCDELRTGAVADARKLYVVLRAKAAELIRKEQDESNVLLWTEAALACEARLRSCEDLVLAERIAALSDLLNDRARFLEQYSQTNVFDRSHVRDLLAVLMDNGGIIARSSIKSKLKLKEANLSRLLTLIEGSDLIERQIRGKERLICLTAAGKEEFLRHEQATMAVLPPVSLALPADLMAQLEYSLGPGDRAIIAADHFEFPRGPLFTAVENNASEGVPYDFFVSSGKKESSKLQIERLKSKIGKALPVKTVDKLIKLRTLPFEMESSPPILFYIRHADKTREPNSAKITAIEGADIGKGITHEYRGLSPKEALRFWGILSSTPAAKKSRLDSTIHLTEENFCSVEEFIELA